jgi:hypothetical protein
MDAPLGTRGIFSTPANLQPDETSNIQDFVRIQFSLRKIHNILIRNDLNVLQISGTETDTAQTCRRSFAIVIEGERLVAVCVRL